MTAIKKPKLTIADRLKIIRENLSKSQKEMAHHIGISLPAWQGYELGKNAPGSSVIEELVMLGYNANWILTGTGKMKDEESFFFKNNRPVNHSDSSFMLSHDVLIKYQDSLQEKIPTKKHSKLLFTLWKILSEQSADWLTEEKAAAVLEALIKISVDFEIFRKLNMNSEATLAFLSFLDRPDSMAGDQEETDQKDKKKV
ncbi:MAG: helix-turn-helix domain-containing protein [Smithellaceae bacterium]